MLGWLGQSDAAVLLRGSFWLYPIVNAAHILGIALLVGGIVPLDLRLLGAWQAVPAAPLAAVLVPMAVAGLVLMLATGPLMFAVQPGDYAGNPWFQVKLVVIVVAIANALLLRRVADWRQAIGGRVRAAAILSIGLWLAAIFCGRMIAFF